MSIGTAPVEFDPLSEDFFNDPYETYRRLRDEAPVYFNERYGFYALSRFADVLAAHRDWEAFSSAHGIELFMLTQKDPEEIRNYRQLIMMDPPEHARFRALVSRVFTPKAVSALEPMIRETICSFLDPLAGLDAFDAVADFAAPFPVEVISKMLGVPEQDRQAIRHRIDLTLHREPGQMAPSPENMEAMLEGAIYLHELTTEKRQHPRDDMLSRLTQVTIDRGDGTETGLDDAEISGFASLLGGAGAETVTKLVGNAVVLFWRHPDAWRKVQHDPEKIPKAVDEILRYWPPSQYQGRYCVEERAFEGGTIPAGFPTLLITGAATRDPREFERPDEFDIERQPGITIGFGHGVHSCLGAALARMESRIAIEELAKRWRRLEVDEAGLRRVHMANVAGYANVPVRRGALDEREHAAVRAYWVSWHGRAWSTRRSPAPPTVLAIAALTASGMASAAADDHAGSHAHHGSHEGDGQAHAGPARTPIPTEEIGADGSVDLSGVDGVTPEQEARAEQLLGQTLAQLPQYADVETAEANGFHPVGDAEHWVNWSYVNDGRILDPAYPESLVYRWSEGGRELVAAMFMMPDGATLDTIPDVGGRLTQWHVHEDICFTPDPVAPRIETFVGVDQPCPSPLEKRAAMPMLHVWIVPHPCGPFAALNGIAGGQIKPGEERWCDHVHGATDAPSL